MGDIRGMHSSQDKVRGVDNGPAPCNEEMGTVQAFLQVLC
jgi:hypothetical protein